MTAPIGAALRALAIRRGARLRGNPRAPADTFQPGACKEGESPLDGRLRLHAERLAHDLARLEACPALAKRYPGWAAGLRQQAWAAGLDAALHGAAIVSPVGASSGA